MGAAESASKETIDSNPTESKNIPISCNILVVGKKSGDDCLTELRWLPPHAHITGTGLNLEELEKDGSHIAEANVLLNVSGDSSILSSILKKTPKLRWIHSLTAGIDHIIFPELASNDNIIMTNAKGIFSSSLAEYVMGACAFFSKDFARLIKQREDRNWNRFCVQELRGQTMGIIGYGDIGKACATLAKAYGMRVLALRRKPGNSEGDPLVDAIYGLEGLETVMSSSDYLVIAAPLTAATQGNVTVLSS